MSRDGIFLVDKPAGCTSHDVVAMARRALGQRDVGHAGTLDPMATGLLVVLAGEGTKLSLYLTADDKRYAATVRFGATTDTLDADGQVVATSDAPAPTGDAVVAALAAMVGPLAQRPPVVSAIKQGGVALHVRARRGEVVEVAARDVVLKAARVCAVRDGECDIEIACSKGFYVRSLARDLAERLGTLGYLTALRRTHAGPFDVAEALAGATLVRAARHSDAGAQAEVNAAVLPVASAARALRTLVVSAEETIALGHGKTCATEAPPGVALVMSADDGRPVCIAEVVDGRLVVLRGFRRPA